MALSSSRLSAAIRAKLVARAFGLDNTAMTQFCDDLASAIITEITANATVLPVLLVAPPGGGPVTGTGLVS
jgi:hypothetical protein